MYSNYRLNQECTIRDMCQTENKFRSATFPMQIYKGLGEWVLVETRESTDVARYNDNRRNSQVLDGWARVQGVSYTFQC